MNRVESGRIPINCALAIGSRSLRKMEVKASAVSKVHGVLHARTA